MRSQAIAATYFENLKTKFTLNTYANAALRARGLKPTNNVYEEFHIFQKTIQENGLYGTLTDLELNNLLDYLIEMST